MSILPSAQLRPQTEQERMQDLRIANSYLESQLMPDGYPFEPIKQDSFFYRLAVRLNMSPSAGVLAASYMQRLLRCNADEIFALANQTASGDGNAISEEQGSDSLVIGEDIPNIVVAMTCFHLAVKIVGRSRLNYNRQMLLSLLGLGSLSDDRMLELELACLEKLKWRLGPVFNQNNIG